MQEQWPFRLPAPEKFNVGPLEGELAVTTPLHLQTDTHTQGIIINSSQDFFYCPEKSNKNKFLVQLNIFVSTLLLKCFSRQAT